MGTLALAADRCDNKKECKLSTRRWHFEGAFLCWFHWRKALGVANSLVDFMRWARHAN